MTVMQSFATWLDNLSWGWVVAAGLFNYILVNRCKQQNLSSR